MKAQDVGELTFLAIQSSPKRLVLKGCSFLPDQSKVFIKKRGRIVALPRAARRKVYRLPRGYKFFACEQNEEGQSVLYAKRSGDGELDTFALTEDDFPKASSSSSSIPDANCKEFPGSIFKPCICADEVPSDIKFRPSLAACGGDAAAILTGSFASSFSVVLRDSQNRDRWPLSGYNGCSAAEVELGLNKCSAFKCQRTIRTAGQFTCCFGEPGRSSIMAPATRMTIKLKDLPTATTDPLLRVCLPGFDPVKNLN